MFTSIYVPLRQRAFILNFSFINGPQLDFCDSKTFTSAIIYIYIYIYIYLSGFFSIVDFDFGGPVIKGFLRIDAVTSGAKRDKTTEI